MTAKTTKDTTSKGRQTATGSATLPLPALEGYYIFDTCPPDAPHQTAPDAGIHIPALGGDLRYDREQQRWINGAGEAHTIEAHRYVYVAAPIIDSAKEAARRGFEKRQDRKRGAIARSSLSSSQKETARIILSREQDSGAPIVNVGQQESDEQILAFDLLIRAGDKHALKIKPAIYDTRPRWLSDKDFKKAVRAFNRTYVTQGEAAFEKDAQGRLVLPLPMTPGRYAGVVVSGDVINVLRFAGAWKPADNGTFYVMACMDGVAPIIASVYRAGARLNDVSTRLDKAQLRLDAASASKIEGLTGKRDALRMERNAARDSFVSAYIKALESAETLTSDARKAAGDALAAFAAIESGTPVEPAVSLSAGESTLLA